MAKCIISDKEAFVGFNTVRTGERFFCSECGEELHPDVSGYIPLHTQTLPDITKEVMGSERARNILCRDILGNLHTWFQWPNLVGKVNVDPTYQELRNRTVFLTDETFDDYYHEGDK